MALVERYHSQEAKQADCVPPRELVPAPSGCSAGPPPRQAVSLVQSAERAEHVGILALEVYFPNVYVSGPSLDSDLTALPCRHAHLLHSRPQHLSQVTACPSMQSQTPYHCICSPLTSWGLAKGYWPSSESSKNHTRLHETSCFAQVSQEELEAHDGVAEGKYTVGLGQRCMAFCGDQEDVVSMSLTAVHALLEKYDVDPRSIGRQGGNTSCPVQRDQRLCVLSLVTA